VAVSLSQPTSTPIVTELKVNDYLVLEVHDVMRAD
jgi:hypothetical protein